MKTSVLIFPFDLFGSSGAAAGAELLGDEIAELLADNRRETVPTRAQAYSPHVRLREGVFDTLEKLHDWRREGRRRCRAALQRDERFIWITGNHLGALPVYEELATLTPAPLIVQLDAHLDIHHFADCTPELSHGNFLLHAEGRLPPLLNFGHRELLLTEEYIARFYQKTFPATTLAGDAKPALKYLAKACSSAARIVVDIDCDVFDPAFFPGVARPVPFGLSPQQVLAILQTIPAERLAGLILSEFHPAHDQHDRSLAALVWLVEYVLLRIYEGRRPPEIQVD